MTETPACSITLFKNVYDNKTHRRMDLASFDEFEQLLFDLSKKPLQSKEEAMLISPATYQPNTTRANANVVDWGGWCAVDVDDHKFEGDLENELVNLYGSYRFVCYSTASSRESLPKFRLAFPMRKRVEADNIKAFWYALQSALGDIGDKQTKDLSRMYYIPGTYAGAFNFCFSNDGDFLNPDKLISQYPMPRTANLNSFFDRLPEEIQKQIIEHRKNNLENTDVSWSSYKNCPFFPKNLASEYRSISNTGWYHKMYQIMVAIAGNAVKNKYPITSQEITNLCRELDTETGNWYENRPMEKEADRAIEYVYKNA